MSLQRRPPRVRMGPTRAARLEPRPSKLSIDYGDAPRPSSADTLILRLSGPTLQLVGGTGRGAGWMGIVDLPLESEPLASRVLRSSSPTHVDATGEAVRVVGPYWAHHAFLVPVGATHLVVFGGSHVLTDPDATLVPAAARLVAELEQVSPEKLLADELEIVQAVRDMMDSRAESVAETARHVASRAADPLSCEVGAVLVRLNGELTAEVVTRDWPTRLDPDEIRETLVKLFDRVEGGAVLEPELEAAADDALGRNQGLVARFAVPIGGAEPFGVLVVAHAATRPRGFTNLCQRIGHALAAAAEPLLLQAGTREALALERDRYARAARTDLMTGLENRAGWELRLADEDARRARHPEPTSILSIDLNGLKKVNDRDGHAAGDRVIMAAGELLRGSARAADHVARVGGDEFLMLLSHTDAAGAAEFVERLMVKALRTECDGVCLSMSIGAATADFAEPLAEVARRADAAMYREKARLTTSR